MTKELAPVDPRVGGLKPGDVRRKIEAMKDIVSMGLVRDAAIAVAVKDWERVSEEAAEYFFEVATREMELYAGQTKHEHLSTSVQYWQTIVKNEGNEYTRAQQIDARKQLDKILGLLDHAQGRTAMPSLYVNGNVSFGALPDDEKEKANKLLEGKVTDEQ